MNSVQEAALFRPLLPSYKTEFLGGPRTKKASLGSNSLVTETKITVLLLHQFLASHWYQELKATPECTTQLFLMGRSISPVGMVLPLL